MRKNGYPKDPPVSWKQSQSFEDWLYELVESQGTQAPEFQAIAQVLGLPRLREVYRRAKAKRMPPASQK